MPPRHARADDDAISAPVSPLRLVDRRPVDPEPVLDGPEDEFSPEVRSVLDAVAALHMAVIGWAAATVDDGSRHHAPPSGSGRHRR